MRFPVAAFMVAVGYAGMYWAIQRFMTYKPNSGKEGAAIDLDPYAAPFGVLLGITRDGKNAKLQKKQNAPFTLGKYEGGTQSSSYNPGSGNSLGSGGVKQA